MTLTNEEFEAINKDSSIDLEEEQEKIQSQLQRCYENIEHLLREYCDLNEDYYSIISLWIIGTYFHKNFPTYPYLFFNAMKGSGKTRTMNLIISLSKSPVSGITSSIPFFNIRVSTWPLSE